MRELETQAVMSAYGDLVMVKEVHPPSAMHGGDHIYRVRDLAGHDWTVAERELENV